MGRQSGDKHRIGERVELPMLEVLPTGGGKAAPAPYGSSDGGKAIFDRTLATQSFGHVDATHYAASAAVPTLR